MNEPGNGLRVAAERSHIGPEGSCRLAVAGGSRLYREGLAEVLALEFSAPVHAVPGVDAFAPVASADLPRLVLLDTRPASPAATVARVIRPPWSAEVIVLGVADEQVVADCVVAGASGVIAPDGALDDVVHAVRSVLRGEFVCSLSSARGLARRLQPWWREDVVEPAPQAA